jgi:hypothetical protein
MVKALTKWRRDQNKELADLKANIDIDLTLKFFD